MGKIPSKGLLNPESCLYLLSTFIKIGSLLPFNKIFFCSSFKSFQGVLISKPNESPTENNYEK